MRFNIISSVLLGAALSVAGAFAGNAPIVINNPRTTVFEVSLLDKSSTSIRGWVTASAPTDGVGVRIHANFWGFPRNVPGPYFYHIHVNPVPPNGDCRATGEHLDPYNRGEQPQCDVNQPQTCQVGDLSGKHAPVYVAPNMSFDIEYPDIFLATAPGSSAYFGNRSIVIHAPDGTRLNCGNWVPSTRR